MPEMLEPLAAKRVRLVGFDVDGVLTDNAVYVGTVGGEPVELKRFDIADGIGIKLLQAVGVHVAFLSGRESEATRLRARELGVADVVQDRQARKLVAFEELLRRYEVRMEDAAFMGDDLPDLPVMRRVGLPVTVPDAATEIRQVARYTTTAAAGRGAVREFVEALLRARGEWDEQVQAYLAERGERAPRRSSMQRAR